jgi:RimJ/RimL family protein N-acetyltransferase
MLGNRFVRLEPIAEAHRAELRAAAADPSIWAHIPFPVLREGFNAYFDLQRDTWSGWGWQTYTVFAGARAVGQTSHMNVRPNDAGVEIGGTWYAPAVQGGPVNPSCKYLLLLHAFACGAERVELKTDALNARSRAAILKLGATFEGIHRRHMRRADGTLRDTAWFSILREEWPQVQERLEARLAAFD